MLYALLQKGYHLKVSLDIVIENLTITLHHSCLKIRIQKSNLIVMNTGGKCNNITIKMQLAYVLL